MSSTERRQHPRIQLDLPLHLTFGDQTFETRIADISTSGIRFRTPQALPLMTRVEIGLELPSSGAEGAVALAGVVVRSDVRPDATGNPDPDGGQYETAIFFDQLSSEAQSQLIRFLEEQ